MEAQERQRRPPGGLALAAEGNLDRGIPILVTLDEPLEAEVNEGRRLDQKLPGRYGVPGRVLC